MTLPEIDGIITAAQTRRTAEHIASLQLPDGLIPWFAGQHADPWDHVEGAMALAAAGLTDEARRAYRWSAENQSADGSWPMEIVGTEVREASVDTNQCAYIAVGVWHDWLLHRDRVFAETMWPTVRAAIEFVLGLQQPTGAVAWSKDAHGVVSDYALLTGSSCLVLSLRAAMALAELVHDPHPDWELSAARLAHTVAAHPETFADKSNFSMDWYYPVLGGAVRGAAAADLLAARWSEFVVPGRGIRCVNDRPWVTAAETCELALTLDAVGEQRRALELLRDVQFLRAADGGYWTGWVYPEEAHWPAEQSSWTSAAVILATDALSAASPAHGLFRGDRLPELFRLDGCDESCAVRTGGQQ